MSNVSDVCELIVTIPRIGNRISWSDHPRTIALIVKAILGSSNETKFIKEVCAKTGVNWQALRKFCFGLGTSHKPWPDLRKILSDMGVVWNKTHEENKTLSESESKSEPVPVIRTTIEENIPHIPLAVVAGKVVSIKPDPPPSVIVAKPGNFAKSGSKTVRKIAPDENGNFVITTITTRTVYQGSGPEYTAILLKAFNKSPSSESAA